MYELCAFQLGQNPNRTTIQNFFVHNASLAAPALMPQTFFAWLAIGCDRIILIDAGLPKNIKRPSILATHELEESLFALGVAPNDVTDLVLTHLHWDHIGRVASFGNATLHLQHAEIAYVTGQAMRHHEISRYYDPALLEHVIARCDPGMAVILEGNSEHIPGVNFYHAGGHTPGTQTIGIATKRGEVHIAADAVPYLANLEKRNPFPIFENLTPVLDTYEYLLRCVNGDLSRIIPGHDPAVLDMFPIHPRLSSARMLHERMPTASWTAEAYAFS